MTSPSATHDRPTVSVIVPIFNRCEFIINALNSVKAQTYRPIELIIIDDGSSDGSLLVVKNWLEWNINSALTAQSYQQENRGAPSARNRGIAHSTGKYLQFLDSDDTLEPEKLTLQVHAMETSGADVAVCDFKYHHEDEDKCRIMRNDGDLLKRIVDGWSIYTSSPLMRAEIVRNKIQWDERLRRQQDIDFIFKLMTISQSYTYTPGALCNYIQHDAGRISDSYWSRPPQFTQRIMSLLIFAYMSRNTIPSGRLVMVFLCIANLAFAAMRSLVGRILRRLLPEPTMRRLVNYINKS